jgi:hypothetical protein
MADASGQTTDTGDQIDIQQDMEDGNLLAVSVPYEFDSAENCLHGKSWEYVGSIVVTLEERDRWLARVKQMDGVSATIHQPGFIGSAGFYRVYTNIQEGINGQLQHIYDFEKNFAAGTVNLAGEKPGSVGAPGPWEGIIPVWGSGRAAANDFQNGRWGWGSANAVLAVSDVFLVKDAIEAIGKGWVNFGTKSANWGATRARLVKRGFGTNSMPIHHVFISQAMIKKYPWLKFVGNQPWNLLSIERDTVAEANGAHQLIHGKYSRELEETWDGLNGVAKRVWIGTPRWPKLVVVSASGKAVVIPLDAANEKK